MRELLARFRAIARARWLELSARLKRTTPRERVLLAVLVMAALVYMPIAASDWRTAQEDAYVDAISEEAAARLALAASRRVEAAASDRAAVEDMRTWGFSALNAQVAAVAIEQALVRAATAVELPGFSVTVAPEPEVIGPTSWIEAEVQADLRWNPTFDFLDAVAAWPEGFRMTSFSYDVGGTPGAPGAGKVRMGLAFPVRLEETSPPAGPTTSGPTTSGEIGGAL